MKLKKSGHWKRQYNAAAQNAKNMQAVCIALMMQLEKDEVQIDMDILKGIHEDGMFISSSKGKGNTLLVHSNTKPAEENGS